MKKLSILCTLLSAALLATAQKPEHALKIGGCYYIQCQKTIVFQGVEVMSMADIEQKGAKVNFDIYSPIGQLDARVRAGKLEGHLAYNYAVASAEDKFEVVDRRDGRVVCHVDKKWNARQERWDLLVWADLYLPDGQRLMLTPDTTNVPFLNMQSGSTFRNMGTAISLN